MCCLRDSKEYFYCNANPIFGRLGNSATENILLTLIDSQGLQSLLYSTISISLTIILSELRSLDHAYDSVYANVI
jgi:hypothetical protein